LIQELYLILDVDESLSIPDALLSIPRQMMCRSLAIIPVLAGANLRGVFMIGGRGQSDLNPAVLQPFAGLTDLVNTALSKVDAMRKMERRLAALQSLNTISHAVSIETDLMNLYKVVHDEIRQILGDISFLIALYDAEKRTIQVPYMVEGGHLGIIQPPPFRLGEGLVSIVVTSGRPLMIVEDTRKMYWEARL
jgi:transcriptional regulator with GAF, ATPase, and Fis domain